MTSSDEELLRTLYPWLVKDVKPVFDTFPLEHIVKNERTSLKDVFKMSRDDVHIASDLGRDALEEKRREAMKSLEAQRDAYILEFFGSMETLMELGHLFIIEEGPLEMFSDFDIDFENYVYRIETTYRIRLKTPEELDG